MVNSKLSKKSLKSRSLKLKNKRTKKSKVSRKNVRKMKGGLKSPILPPPPSHSSPLANNNNHIPLPTVFPPSLQEQDKQDRIRTGEILDKWKTLTHEEKENFLDSLQLDTEICKKIDKSNPRPNTFKKAKSFLHILKKNINNYAEYYELFEELINKFNCGKCFISRTDYSIAQEKRDFNETARKGSQRDPQYGVKRGQYLSLNQRSSRKHRKEYFEKLKQTWENNTP